MATVSLAAPRCQGQYTLEARFQVPLSSAQALVTVIEQLGACTRLYRMEIGQCNNKQLTKMNDNKLSDFGELSGKFLVLNYCVLSSCILF